MDDKPDARAKTETSYRVVDRRVTAQEEPAPAAEEAQEEAKEKEAKEKEQAAAPAAPPPAEAELAELQKQLEAKQKRLDEVTRAYAALINEQSELKVRLNREKDRVLEVERGNVALGLIEAVDGLDLALAAKPDDSSALAQGVRMVRDGLLRRLTQTGVARLEVAGKPFDPVSSEAVEVEEVSDERRDGVVLAELRAGYCMGERVVRAARVRVGKRAAAQPGAET